MADEFAAQVIAQRRMIRDLRAQLAAAEEMNRQATAFKGAIAYELGMDGSDGNAVLEKLRCTRADRDRLAGEVVALRALVAAAKCSDVDGLELMDVGGVNWWDARDAALAQPAQESAPGPREGAVKRSEYWKAENIAANAEIERLKEALQLLYDNQNGCPLPKYEADWNRAMQLAEAVLYPPATDAIEKGGEA